MGIETILFAAFTGLKAISQMNAAKADAKNVVNNANAANASLAIEGNLATKEKAKEVRNNAARQTVSFLNSGITLEGTPQGAIDETFSTGLADINNIKNNYSTRIGNNVGAAAGSSKSIIAKGRSEAISTIANGFMGASAGGSMGSMFDTGLSYAPESASFAANNAGFGNDAFNALSLKDARG